MPDIELKNRIKSMLVESLMLKIRPEDISDEAPLFSPEGLGLDSIDALELAVALERQFGVKIPNASVARTAFENVNALAAHVEAETGGRSAA